MKILEFFGEPLSFGGQESFIINMYDNFVKNENYTFLTPFNNNNYYLKTKLRNNDRCISQNYKFESRLRKFYILKTGLRCINSQYDVIHIHSGSVFTLLLIAAVAKRRGVKKIIVHSHATGYSTITHKIIKTISDKLLSKYVDYYLACSKEAGEYKFPASVISNHNKFEIIMNGINVEKYIFSETYRKAKRAELKLKDEFVICHVGRYSPEKNHIFIIQVLEEYLKLDKNVVLLLIGGEGSSSQEIENIINEKGLSSNIIMLKERTDINELLSAADIFIFPSLFEGLGISAIEAQASGLITICSDNVPDQTNVSHMFHHLPLEDGAQKWAEYIFKNRDYSRDNVKQEIIDHGFSAQICAKRLEEIYLESSG